MESFPVKIQAIYYTIDIVPYVQADFKPFWIYNDPRTHRLCITESYKILDSDLPAEKRRGVKSTTTELTYSIVGNPNGVKIDDYLNLCFESAGLKCNAIASGPAFAAKSIPTSSPLPLLLPASAFDLLGQAVLPGPSAQVSYVRRLLRDAYPSAFDWIDRPDFASLREDIAAAYRSSGPTASQVKDKQSWNLDVLRLGTPLSGSMAVADFSADLFKASLEDTNDTFALADGSMGTVAPIFWYPFMQEAFAVGAIAMNDSFHAFGRLGGKSKGYRVGKTVYSFSTNGEGYELDYGRFRTPDAQAASGSDYSKSAAFTLKGNLGEIPSEEMYLDPNLQTKFYREPFPFYLGAMPVVDPTSIADLAALSVIELGPQISYLTGSLRPPIIFDPQVNCPPC